MQKYIFTRILQGILVILGATIAAFLIVRLLPADPVRLINPMATEAQLQAIREKLGYTKPLFVQLWIFIRQAIQGDFGTSIYLNDTATHMIAQTFPFTMILAFGALGFALLVSIPLGVLAAIKRDSVWDRIILFFSIGILSMPNFWLGLILIFLVAVNWGLLPAQGFSSWKNFILPAFTLSLTLMPTYIRNVRAAMIDILNQDFIKALIARGVPMRSVIFKHSLKNIAVPLLTGIGINLGQLLGGALVIELVFNFPGIGLLMFKAVLRRDYPLVQGITVVMATIFVSLNLLIDLSYSFLDPRIRTQESLK